MPMKAKQVEQEETVEPFKGNLARSAAFVSWLQARGIVEEMNAGNGPEGEDGDQLMRVALVLVQDRANAILTRPADSWPQVLEKLHLLSTMLVDHEVNRRADARLMAASIENDVIRLSQRTREEWG
jgi:hypothetical protein